MTIDFNAGATHVLRSAGLSDADIAKITDTQRDFILGHEMMHAIMRSVAEGGTPKVTLTITLDAEAFMHEEFRKIGAALESWGKEITSDGTRALGRWAVRDEAYMDGGYDDPTIKLELV